ncbi:capsular biosynthesis protein [Novosphingobium sp. PASSN1]|uniref:capsular polysaccharide export protein, LipB/KpsS family n=1 Tax=Novosphingobium sp. PASSN1 TaxID=2015561 RepID=UPI0025F40518|nr:capsular biosynthesis protein [Novosphingobium sp. PASSN1]
MADTERGPAYDRIIAVGLRQWKAHNLSPMLQAQCRRLHFVRGSKAVAALAPSAADAIAIWGATPPPGIADLACATGAALLRLEDGFIRSVGLGSDLIPPQSLVLDRTGIYFDATRASDLETILQTNTFGADMLARAAQIRALIVASGLTKYNIEPRTVPRWPAPAPGRPIVLVPGQVETDASIALGGAHVRSNLALLRAVRSARPDAWIVYKPHPDVMSGNRSGRTALRETQAVADWIETDASIVSCIEACDEVHTITSLSGFDALLRGKPVITYGAPFYAGWGLTEDRAEVSAAWPRRTRRLTLDALVAGALLVYPYYWNPEARCGDVCETVLYRIAQTRDLLQSTGKLEQLRSGWARRQFRKMRVLKDALWGRR